MGGCIPILFIRGHAAPPPPPNPLAVFPSCAALEKKYISRLPETVAFIVHLKGEVKSTSLLIKDCNTTQKLAFLSFQ